MTGVAVPVEEAPPVAPAAPAAVAAITRREVWLVAVASVLLSLAMNWPLPLHLGSHIGEDLGDPVRTAWQIAWEGHALLHSPTHLYQANAFWPLSDSFAFSDSLLGFMPAGVIGHGLVAALVRYNLLFLFAYALCFFGAYLLARELGLRRAGAVIAGAAFAYAPFRLTMNGHLHVISSGGIPLALFFLVRGYRRRSWRSVLAGWLVASWQLSLGFTLGLQLASLLAVLGAALAVVWVRRGRPPLGSRVAAATIAGLACMAAIGLLEGLPLLHVAHEFSTAKRGADEIARYSAPPKAFLSAPPEDRVWGAATAGVRRTLTSPNEQNQFPGLTIFALALLGLVGGSAFTRRFRGVLGAVIVVVALTSLGYGIFGGALFDLLRHIPGWDGVRTPGRLITLTSLGLAILAAAGAERLVGAVRRHVPGRSAFEARAVPLVCAGVLVLAVLAEGRGSMPNPAVPLGAPTSAGPQIDLPTNPAYDRVYQFWTAARFQPLENGVATFSIPNEDALHDWMNRFPDAYSIYLLRHLGIRTVFLHLGIQRYQIPHQFQLPYPGDVRAAAARSVRGLPVIRVVRLGDTIRYDLRPLPVTRAQALRFFLHIHV